MYVSVIPIGLTVCNYSQTDTLMGAWFKTSFNANYVNKDKCKDGVLSTHV